MSRVLMFLLVATPLAAQLPPADHAAKRQVVLSALTQDGIIFVEGTAAPPREDQAFIQSQNFQALTGVVQPGSALLLWRKNGVTGERVVVPPKPVYAWEGEQIGPVEAGALSGAPAIPTTALRALLDSLDAPHMRVYLLPQDAGWPGLSTQLVAVLGDSGVIRGGRGRGRGGAMPADQQGGIAGRGRGALQSLSVDSLPDRLRAPAGGDELAAITRAMSQARARKTDAEIALIKRAAEISVQGHIAAMRAAHPGVAEYELRGALEGKFLTAGGERLGYPSIVGAGANSTFLHYSADTARSKRGDVVVIDAASDYKGYSADVTRTFPVNGKFSPEQRIIYSAVLAAQTAAAAQVKPGATMRDLNAAANAELWKGLVKAGLVDSIGATYLPAAGGRGGGAPIPASQLGLFYFHGLGHGLGLDVHDPIFTDSTRFVVNSIFTIEPGLYVRPATLDMVADVQQNAAYRAKLRKVLARYSGIGTRIEDDWVVTATGVTCLSCRAPRQIADVEAMVGRDLAKRKN